MTTKTIEELTQGISIRTGQRYRVLVPRRTTAVRVVGAAFDTDKTFLKPGALRAMRLIRELFRRERPFELLLVGHADTVGAEVHNDRLSLARADSVKAFLKDDVQAWLDNYGSSQGQSSRWGDAENRMMLSAMPNFRERPSGEDPVKFFQRTHELEPDGIVGPLTRERLVTAYMLLDGPSLSEEGPELPMTTHGCGEHFPLDESGRNVEDDAADDKEDAMDRRVELFLFSQLTGIDPAPPGPNSSRTDSQYHAWRAQVAATEEFAVDEAPRLISLQLVSGAGTPSPAHRFEIDLGGSIVEGSVIDGKLEVEIPANIVDCKLTLHFDSGASVSTKLTILDSLTAKDEKSSRAKLNNLRFEVGAVASNDSAATRRGVLAFQHHSKLEMTAELDSPTLDALEQRYLSMMG